MGIVWGLMGVLRMNLTVLRMIYYDVEWAFLPSSLHRLIKIG